VSESFGVGEIAIIVAAPDCDHIFPEFIGSEVEVTAPLDWVWVWEDRKHRSRRREQAYIVRLPNGEEIAALPESLRKRPPPREPTSTWDDVIVWRPKETAHVG
jgi:hypothetical protein